MIAVGTDPGSISRGGTSALDYLQARQDSDGHFRYSSSSDQTPVWVTGQVLPAVAGKAFPALAAAAGTEAEAGAEHAGRNLVGPGDSPVDAGALLAGGSLTRVPAASAPARNRPRAAHSR